MLKRKPDILQTYLAPISTGNQSDVHQLSATQQVLPSSRNVIMLTNIPELVSSYTIEGLLEINETSLKGCLPLSTLILDISQDKDLYLFNLFSNTCSTSIWWFLASGQWPPIIKTCLAWLWRNSQIVPQQHSGVGYSIPWSFVEKNENRW